eukprot:Opistho-2@64958
MARQNALSNAENNVFNGGGNGIIAHLGDLTASADTKHVTCNVIRRERTYALMCARLRSCSVTTLFSFEASALRSWRTRDITVSTECSEVTAAFFFPRASGDAGAFRFRSILNDNRDTTALGYDVGGFRVPMYSALI